MSRLKIIAPCPDVAWAKRLTYSAKQHGLEVLCYSMDRPHGSPHNGDIQGTYVVELLPQLDDEYIMALDAPDTMVMADEDEIMEKFFKFNQGFVISAETNNILPTCGITEALEAYPGRYKFPNGGAWIGERLCALETIKRCTELYRHKPLDPTLDLDAPQAWLTEALFEKTMYFGVDRDAVIFQSTMGWAANDVEIRRGRMHNLYTNTIPCVAHYNGQRNDLSTFYRQFGKIYGPVF